jgi:hypothetical protein
MPCTASSARLSCDWGWRLTEWRNPLVELANCGCGRPRSFFIFIVRMVFSALTHIRPPTQRGSLEIVTLISCFYTSCIYQCSPLLMRLAFFFLAPRCCFRSFFRNLCVPLSCIRHGFKMWAAIPDRHSLFRFMSRSIPCPRSNSALVVRCSLLPSPLPVVALSPFLLVFIFACLCLIRSLPCEGGFIGRNIWIFPTLLAFAGEGAVYIVPPRNPHISHVDFSSLAGSLRIRGVAVPREHYDVDPVF